MQDNPFNEAFLNEAWEDMRSQLDAVMPVENRRRLLIGWWLSGAAIMLILMTILRVGEQNEPAMLQAGTNAKQLMEEPSIKEEKKAPTKTKAITTISTPQQVQLTPAEQAPVKGAVVSSPENRLESAAQMSSVEVSSRESTRISRLASMQILSPRPIKISFDDSLILTFTPSENSLVLNNKKEKQLDLLAYTEAHYEARLSQWSATLGLGGQYVFGRFYLGISPGIQWGRAALDFSSQEESLFAVAEQDNIGMQPTTSFQPGFSSADPREIDFRFTHFRLPVHFGYHLGKKWTIETGFIWNNILHFSAINQTDMDTYRNYQQNNSNPTTVISESQRLTSLLERRNFIQGQIGIQYRVGEKWQTYASYQHALSPVLAYDQLQWNRNYATIGLRYEINSYIFGKK